MNETELSEYFVKLRNGNKEAFAAVYHSMKQPVFTVIYRIVGNKETAEDLTHDVFVKLFQFPPDPSVKKIRAWIFRMARNLAIDALRKKECDELQENVPVSEDGFDQLMQRMDIDAAISKLPCLEREVFTLHVDGEFTFHEISSIVHLSFPSVYRKYRKALNLMRKELSGGAL